MSESLYLGDGAYVTRQADGRMVLSTGSHLRAEAGNVMFLEPEHMHLLHLFFLGEVKGEDAGEGGF